MAEEDGALQQHHYSYQDQQSWFLSLKLKQNPILATSPIISLHQELRLKVSKDVHACVICAHQDQGAEHYYW